MFRRNKFSDILSCELHDLRRHAPIVILSMIAGCAVILLSWMCFGGPCRAAVLFTIPGGGITIAAYYILWFLMFAFCGCEVSLLFIQKNSRIGKALLYHAASHLCMFLWYPLFFTSFSQFLALIVIISAIILIILEIKETIWCSLLLSVSAVIKIFVLLAFTYVNLAFLVVN